MALFVERLLRNVISFTHFRSIIEQARVVDDNLCIREYYERIPDRVSEVRIGRNPNRKAKKVLSLKQSLFSWELVIPLKTIHGLLEIIKYSTIACFSMQIMLIMN